MAPFIKHKNSLITFFALLFWLSPCQAEATNPRPPLAFTETQILAIFYQRNLDLIAAHFNIDAAQAQDIIAAAIPNPVFSLSISSLSPELGRAQNNGQAVPGVSPQIQQLIETAGKRRLRMESGELGITAATLDVQDTVRVLTNAVRHRFYGLLLAQKNLELADDNYHRYQHIQTANAVRLKLGDVSAIDFARIEVEALKAQADQDQARAALTQAQADLLQLLAWPEHSLALQAADAWPEADQTIAQAGQDQLLGRALAQRPDLQAARVRITQAGKLLALANRQQIPDVTVGAFWQHDQGNYFAESGGVSVSVPLPLFYRQEGEIAGAHVNLETAKLAVKQAEQTVKAELVKALASWHSADAIAQRFEQSIVQRIAKLREAQEFAYQKGAVGLLDLLDAERNYKAMMLDYYTALANRSLAWADLLMAYGEGQK